MLALPWFVLLLLLLLASGCTFSFWSAAESARLPSAQRPSADQLRFDALAPAPLSVSLARLRPALLLLLLLLLLTPLSALVRRLGNGLRKELSPAMVANCGTEALESREDSDVAGREKKRRSACVGRRRRGRALAGGSRTSDVTTAADLVGAFDFRVFVRALGNDDSGFRGLS